MQNAHAQSCLTHNQVVIVCKICTQDLFNLIAQQMKVVRLGQKKLRTQFFTQLFVATDVRCTEYPNRNFTQRCFVFDVNQHF